MALKLSFSTCPKKGCGSIIFTETTGTYNATLNPTGWGAPNLTLGAVTETHILITLPDGETIIDILNPVGLPTGTLGLEYEILASALDVDTIEDGLYIIEYTVTDGITVYTTGTKYFLYTCNLDCCVAKIVAKIATSSDCTCDSTIIKNAVYASALLKGLKALAGCGDRTAIDNLIIKLNKICGFSSSNCGCS